MVASRFRVLGKEPSSLMGHLDWEVAWCCQSCEEDNLDMVQHLVVVVVAVDRADLDNGIHTVVVDVLDVLDTYEMEELLEGNTVLSSQQDAAGVVSPIALDLQIIALVDL
jgi:hypothetical protein